jgi:hypothetical protein
MIKLPIFVLLWAGYVLLIKAPAFVLGLVVTPFLYRLRLDAYEDLERTWYWQLIRPWVNPEDWYGQRAANRPEYESLPHWWAVEYGAGLLSWYKYHAIRNTGNGLRSYEWLDVDIDPAKVKYVANVYMDSYEPGLLEKAGGRTAAYLAWQGFRAGCQVIHLWPDLKRDIRLWRWTLLKAGPKYLVIKFGWRVHPCDKENPDHRDRALAEDSGFAGKVLPYRDWAR